MDLLKSWGITVCLAALAAGIAGIIAPTGKMEKVYKFAVSLFFLCCLLVPLFSLKNITLRSVRLDNAYNRTNSNMIYTVSEQAIRIARINITDLIISCCRNSGTVPERVDVKIAYNNGKMSVGSVKVTLKATDDKKCQSVREAIKNKLGLDATISTEAG